MRNVALTALIVLGGVFGLQNVQEVPVTFLLWQTSTYLAVALLMALAIGILIGILLVLPWAWRHRRQARNALASRAAPPTSSGVRYDGSESPTSPEQRSTNPKSNPLSGD